MTIQDLRARRRNQLSRWVAIASLAGMLASGCSNGKAKDKDSAEEKNTAVPE